MLKNLIKQKFRLISFKELEALRLNLSIMKKEDWVEFMAYAQKTDKKTQSICALAKKNANR